MAIELAAISLVCGCSGSTPPPTETDSPTETRAIEPAVRGGVAGLEIVSWGVDDATGSAGRLLARVLSDGAADITPPAWEDNGLRLLRVPVEQLDTLAGELRPLGVARREWFGEFASWTPVVIGSPWSTTRAISIPDVRGGSRDSRSVIRLQAGRLRLLARAYTLPTLGDGDGVIASLQIDLTLQHEPAARPLRGLDLTPGTDVASRGQVFTRLTHSISSTGRHAFVIVRERPGTRWVTEEEISNEAPGPTLDTPGIEGPLTLGDALLAPFDGDDHESRRAIIVLVPRIHGEYPLLASKPGV